MVVMEDSLSTWFTPLRSRVYYPVTVLLDEPAVAHGGVCFDNANVDYFVL